MGDNDNSLLIRRVFGDCLEHLFDFSSTSLTDALLCLRGAVLMSFISRFGIYPTISTTTTTTLLEYIKLTRSETRYLNSFLPLCRAQLVRSSSSSGSKNMR
ncbi:hypothetical protein K443DRAFT_150310 [Laccaria amethystina LaAM-08-1]|jgi:hypothetical protein|uniref:Unplaced genomic scaffold K443scaffold_10, whole genome shotgun sequence n=1 Tax=Laccaria amethystina LaAM-08-1 TaxID=1095629 RepID=A0A0C9XRX7_9AGAR|nr:hypothetical protein K443DRAFT_150310 [Laccaria amethystina LaAM-08-1]